MKILFFPIYPIKPHFETDLELMATHLDKGDQVFVLMCSRRLKTCFHNFHHKLSFCLTCQSRILNGLKVLKINSNNIFSLPSAHPSFQSIPKVVRNVDELMDFSIDNIRIGTAAASSLIYHLNRDYKFNTILHKKEVYRQLKNDYSLYVNYTRILKTLKPDLVYIFNGRFSEHRVQVMACLALGIQFYTHERSGSSLRYVLRKNSVPQDIAYAKREMEELWAMDKSSEKQKIGEAWFTDRRKGVEQGWVSYTTDQKQGLLPPRFNPAERNIAVFNSTIEEYCTLKEYYPTKIYKNENIALYRILKSLVGEPNVHIYLRIHPNLKNTINFQTRSVEFMARKFANFTVIEPTSPVSTNSLVDHSDLIITFGSTVGIEAAYWNKPAILIGSAAYEDLDVQYIPKDHEDVLKLIKTPLKPKDKKNALKFGYWQTVFGTPYKKFKQVNLNDGYFLGRLIKVHPFTLISAAFLRIIEIKSLEDLKKYINRLRKGIL